MKARLPGPVLLDAHNAAVAERARELSDRVGLPPPQRQVALSDAGRLHDVGKRDKRFQRFTLGNADGNRRTLAKSHNGSIRQARTPNAGGLPNQWRHEQLSAAIAAAELDASDSRDLVLRLVGTSHGHGRPVFPHASSSLLRPDEDERVARYALQLFDIGVWDEVIESTHDRWGVWGCAYLEALLRAADGQISGEGR